MKKIVSLMLVWILALTSIVACSSTSKTSENDKPAVAEQTEQPKPKKEVNLKFSIWGNDAHKKMYEAMIAKYRETNPNVNVEIIAIPNTEYLQKLSIMTASKTAPDIAWLSETMIPQFLTNDSLLDISKLKTDSAYNFKDIIPSTLELLTKGNKLFGIPFSTPPIMIYYNKKLFAEKGLKTPTELFKEGKWTYDEFQKAAKAIANPEKGVYGVNYVRGGWNNWLGYLTSIFRAHGAELLSPDGTKFTLNSKQGEQALQIYYDLIFKDKSHPKPGDQTTFETGKIGMQQELFSYMSKANSIKDFEWDIAPMPAGPAGQGTWIGYAGYSILKDTKNPDEAYDFLKFITNPENAVTASQFFVPSRKAILQSNEFVKGAPSPESMKIAVLDPMEKAQPIVPGQLNWQQIDTKVRAIIDYLYTQNISVKEVLDRMEKEVSPLLK